MMYTSFDEAKGRLLAQRNATTLCLIAGVTIAGIAATFVVFSKATRASALSELSATGWTLSSTYETDWQGRYLPRNKTSVSLLEEPHVAVGDLDRCFNQRDLRLLTKFRRIDSIRIRLKKDCLTKCSLSQLSQLPALSYFAIENVSVPPTEIVAITTFPKLKSLSFGHCDLRGSAVSQLASMQTLRTIECVDCLFDVDDLNKLKALRPDISITDNDVPSLP